MDLWAPAGYIYTANDDLAPRRAAFKDYLRQGRGPPQPAQQPESLFYVMAGVNEERVEAAMAKHDSLYIGTSKR